MSLDPVDELLKRLAKGGEWPPKSEAKTWADVLAWRAFLESDRDALKRVAGWESKDREYKIDPLPERIADAWSDHLFGEEITIKAAVDADEDALGEILEVNDITDDFRAAERDIVAEGEGWWRIYVDRDVDDVPLLEWHSRATVAPFYIGKKLLAVALITQLEGVGRAPSKSTIHRHLEIHVDGAVEHVLFRGTKNRLGQTVPLDDHPETQPLATILGDGRQQGAIWKHGLPMLMGRIINKRGRNPRLGVSEYDGIKDYLLELNEAVTIGGENMRLTAKKRITAPLTSTALRPTTGPLVDNGEGQLVPLDGKPAFAADEDVLLTDPTDNELGRDSTPFKVLEYSYDAQALILHKRDLVESAVTRIGLTPQWIGVRVEGEGLAVSGTSLRLRLVPTDKAGRGKGRPWDKEAPRIIGLMQRLHAMPESEGGFGRPWSNPDELPSVKRANPLPTDEVEQASVESTLVTAGARSIATSVRNQHPEWTDQQVLDEVDAIKKDRPSAGGLLA